MNLRSRLFVWILLVIPGCAWAAATTAAKQPVDPLGRESPRSSVTGFLEACHNQNYTRAAEYLDLREIPLNRRAQQGPELAKELEAILNSDSSFNVLRLSQSPEGSVPGAGTSALERVATVTHDQEAVPINLERIESQPNVYVWVFSPATVAFIPELAPNLALTGFEKHLPHFLVSVHLLDTALWKWLALILVAICVFAVFRLAAHLLLLLIGKVSAHLRHPRRWAWIQALLRPGLVFASAVAFSIIEQFIDPSALSRLYIGRALLLVVVCSFAWCFINLVDLFLAHLDALLNPRQRVVSHSLIYLARRAAKVTIAVIAAIVVLNNWGYNMTTIIAGLGVSGIAIALAAQSTIANVFGGVSVIGDSPVMVGDFGNFGGVMGTVEDIGMRSTRIRTLNRTIMSIPNASFATMNLENYAVRDKILFNSTVQIKRTVPKEKIRAAMKAVADLLANDKRVEIGPSPVRLSGLTTGSFPMEIFAYVLTDDINEFYKIEADLFLTIDDALAAAGVELA